MVGAKRAHVCICESRKTEQVCVRQLDAGQMKPGSCFGSSFSPKCPYPPTLLPSPISFPRRIPHPSPFCHAVRNLFPGAEATLMWEAWQRQSETQTLQPHRHTHTLTGAQTATHTHTQGSLLSDLPTWHVRPLFPSVI